MKWFPLINYTHYSLQYGFSKPRELAKKCQENSYRACGIADYKSISGAVSFYKTCVEAGIKPIIGCSFDDFSLFTKNHEGWLDLIQIVSAIDSDGKEDRGTIVKLARKGNLICLAKSESVSPITGDDFYERSDAFPQSHYANKDQADLHRVLLCSRLKTTFHKVKNLGVDPEFQIFFDTSDFYVIESKEASHLLVSDPRMEDFDEIFKKVENFDILSRPILPRFDVPSNFKDEGAYLRHLARAGWMKLLNDKIKTEEDRKIYGDKLLRRQTCLGTFLSFGTFLTGVESRVGW
jgi:DNA polymerase III alpha subunit